MTHPLKIAESSRGLSATAELLVTACDKTSDVLKTELLFHCNLLIGVSSTLCLTANTIQTISQQPLYSLKARTLCPTLVRPGFYTVLPYYW